ncbi:hypothetical protein [Salinimonas chungwhensis]
MKGEFLSKRATTRWRDRPQVVCIRLYRICGSALYVIWSFNLLYLN